MDETVSTSRQPSPDRKNDGDNRSDRTPSISRTRGVLYYRKRRPFSKYKQHFVVLDEEKFQMSFYKSEEDHDRLASCKLSVDLRFIDDVQPSRSGLMNRRSGFKVFRRAGLSTLSLAADTEEDRAKWINTLDGIVNQVKASLERESSVKSQSLPAPTKIQDDKDYDSDNSKTSSVPDDVQIKPKRASRIGFPVDSNQISSIKLRRVNSDVKSTSPEPVIPENRESQTSFGVTLKKVDMEEIKRRKSKENTEEVTEFQTKFHSLSRPRSRSPNIPLSDKLKSSKGDVSVLESPKRMTLPSSLPRSDRKRSQVSNIPLSDSVKSVIKHTQDQTDDDISLELSEPNLLQRQGSKICHATTTEIQVFQCNEFEVVKVEDEEGTVPVESVKYERSESAHSQTSDKTMIVNLDEESSCKSFIKDELEEMEYRKPEAIESSSSSSEEDSGTEVEEETVVEKRQSLSELLEQDQNQAYIKEDIKLRELETSEPIVSSSSSSDEDSGTDIEEETIMEKNQQLPEVLEKNQNTNINNDGITILAQKENDVISNNSGDFPPNHKSAEVIGITLSQDIIKDTLNAYSEPNVKDKENYSTALSREILENSLEELKEKERSSVGNSSEEKIEAKENDKEAETKEAEPTMDKSMEDTPTEEPSQLSFQISVSNENDQIISIESSSPVQIRRQFNQSYNSVYSKNDSKRPSNMSLMSSESDDPLPRHNFLGKSERASLTFPMYSGQFSIEEEDHPIAPKPPKRQSLIHFDSSKSLDSPTAKISFIEPEEVDQLKAISEDESPMQSPVKTSPEVLLERLQADHNPPTEEKSSVDSTNDSSSSGTSSEEEEEEGDTFPSYEGIEYRMKNLSVKEEEILRTSGIAGLKEYLDGLDQSDHVTDQKVGVNRLGSSVAVEKLRKELQ